MSAPGLLMTNSRPGVAVVFGSKVGVGGLGHSAATAITAAARTSGRVFALGPGHATPWSLPGGLPQVEWVPAPEFVPGWMTRYSWLRWRTGDLVLRRNASLGRWAAGHAERLQPQAVYSLTEVAREILHWANRSKIPSVLDNPNGHIRNFQQVLDREFRQWCSGRSRGHPSPEMVDRVMQEYELASRIRVYSQWGKKSMVDFGVPAGKIHVVNQTVNLDRFHPPTSRPRPHGPLRVCYVGSLCLRKGFVYLLRAIKAIGAQHVALEIVGATGDRHSARLFDAERQGLAITCAPGDPLPAYQRAELFVLPTLEDGLPFVLLEAMAAGLPVIVTNEAGAGECVRPGRTGWVIPAGQVDALTEALEQAIRCRNDLPDMGVQARADMEQYAGPGRVQELADWLLNGVSQQCFG